MGKKLLLIFIFTPVLLVAKNLGNTDLQIREMCSAFISSRNFFKIVPDVSYAVKFDDHISFDKTKDINLSSSTSYISLTSDLYSTYPSKVKISFNSFQMSPWIPDSEVGMYGEVGIDKFKKLLSGDDLKLEFIKSKKIIQKVKEEIPIFSLEYYKLLKKDPPPPRYIDKATYIDEVYEYNIINAKEVWANAHDNCLKQIEKDRNEIYLKWVVAIIITIIGIFIAIRVIKALIKLSKKKISQGKDKLKEIEKEKAEKRIREIAEEESIRASVKKSIDESKDDDLEELQKLINKAVEKGDSETAQSLLKILNSKRNI